MPLNRVKGNMYEFITDTWNAIKGECPHECTYCYMRRFKNQKSPRLDESEFKTDLGSGKYIFVGSSIDMFADQKIIIKWVRKTLEFISRFDNVYLLQTKNPLNFSFYKQLMPKKVIFCTTLESNFYYSDIMGNAPSPQDRSIAFQSRLPGKKMITIEPVMNFDIDSFVKMIRRINPFQINIGADSGGHKLPEPSKDKLQIFISVLQGLGYDVHLKPNIKRLFR